MDWNLKTPTWGFSEFEQGTVANIDGVSGSSSFTGHGIKSDFSVDLKLGHVIDAGNEATNASKMISSPSGSAKRARAIGTGFLNALCLVDGCKADLSICREYHRRHKVCEVHSKTPEVRINGVKQRFCQQCSRFHSLEEFDEGKRSCRKRLDGHNRRRRKPQPENLSHSGSLFSNQGSTMLQFSSPQVYTTTAVTNPIWAGFVKAEEDVKFYYPHRQNSLPESSSSSSNKGPGHQFSLFHSTNLELNNHTPKKTSTCQPLLSTLTSSETSSSSDKMFCDGFTSRDCALSLLSSSSTQTSCIGPSHVIQPSLIPSGHPLDSGLTYSSLEPMESILVQNGTGDQDAHCQGMFQMAPHASRDNETPQTLPFYWE